MNFLFSYGEGDGQVWDFIENDRTIVILHLTRNNILRSYVSKQIGLKTRYWTENIHRPNPITPQEKKVILDAKKCRDHFEEIENYQNLTIRRFKGHKVIPVVYENLAANKQEIMSRIYNELGVSDYAINPSMKKQNPEPLEELVINFNELKHFFTNSKWESFFYD